jgi:hypothetical protein
LAGPLVWITHVSPATTATVGAFASTVPSLVRVDEVSAFRRVSLSRYTTLFDHFKAVLRAAGLADMRFDAEGHVVDADTVEEECDLTLMVRRSPACWTLAARLKASRNGLRGTGRFSG